MKRVILLLLAASAVFSGCASAPKPNPDLQSKKFSVAAGKSSIYIFRNQGLASALSIDLLVDGKIIGQSDPSAYFIIDVEPGRHKINCEDGSSDSFMLTTKRDHIYFVKQVVESGYSSVSCSFHQVTDAEGKDAVSGCDLKGRLSSGMTLN
ncbi:MAG: DUF2846 domain-containing protein [Desulfuromonadaceae bacterium]|nr:DUF2846 domain-containing protein [Desulfuromonadaceae bacterium]